MERSTTMGHRVYYTAPSWCTCQGETRRDETRRGVYKYPLPHCLRCGQRHRKIPRANSNHDDALAR